jgi:cell division protein FtsL
MSVAGSKEALHRAAGEARPAKPSFQPNLRLVHADELTRAGRRRRFRLAVATMSALAVASAFGVVGMHVMLAQNQFVLDRLDTKAAEEQAQYEKLRLQVDQLESPQRIVAVAKDKLGMQQPGAVTYLTPSAPLSVPGGSNPVTGARSAPSTGGGPVNWATVKPQLVPPP